MSGGVSDRSAPSMPKKVRAPSCSQEDARVRRQEKLCWNDSLRAERKIDTG